MQLNLLFTNDWELFGDGSGSFTEVQERPLQDLVSAFSAHSARFTLFAEIGQQWAHRALGEDWATALADRWEQVVAQTVAQGHDVQLHLHPTWLNAKRENSRWQLDFSNWQLKTLPRERIEEVLTRGRQTLEAVGRKARADYQCVAFRAGAFCIQPEEQTVPALLKAGLKADSSVVPGLSDFMFFDFTRARQEPGSYQGRQTNLSEMADKGEPSLLELPTHTGRVWDSPILRRLVPAQWVTRLQYGTSRDTPMPLGRKHVISA